MPFLIFYIPCPNEKTATQIAQQMLDLKLTACANIFPIQSMFWWQSAIQNEQEWVTMLKTIPELETALETRIIQEHPYQTPCILRFEAKANAHYENWIRENVKLPEL